MQTRTRTIRPNMQAALAANNIPTGDTYPTQRFYYKHPHAFAYGIMAEKAYAGLRASDPDSILYRGYNEANEIAYNACKDIDDFAQAFEFVRNPANAILLDEILEGYANG